MELHELLKFTSLTACIISTLDWLKKEHARDRPLQIVAFSSVVFASSINKQRYYHRLVPFLLRDHESKTTTTTTKPMLRGNSQSDIKYRCWTFKTLSDKINSFNICRRLRFNKGWNLKMSLWQFHFDNITNRLSSVSKVIHEMTFFGCLSKTISSQLIRNRRDCKLDNKTVTCLTIYRRIVILLLSVVPSRFIKEAQGRRERRR